MGSVAARAWRAGRRGARRAAKHARQRLRRDPPRATPVFVVGCQRSGTTLLMDILDRSPETRVYQEYDRAAFRNWRLRPAGERAALLAGARCRRVVYKPLQDSQHVDRLLAEDPQARAVWVLRRYPGVVRSWTAKWGADLHPALHSLATDPACEHWLAERMPPERRRVVSELFHEDLSVPSNAALRWILRNEIFFDRSLDTTPERVHPIWYEDLLRDPQAVGASLFAWLGLEFDPAFLGDLVGGAAADVAAPPIDDALRVLCDDLTRRLEAAVPPRDVARA